MRYTSLPPTPLHLRLLICYSNMFYLTINKNPALYKFVQSSRGILSNYPGLSDNSIQMEISDFKFTPFFLYDNYK